MRINGSTDTQGQVGFTVRNLIASQLRVNLKRVTDEARLVDLGADWLDRLELMIAIEDQFAGVEIGEDQQDQLLVVGDLIRFIEAHQPNGRGSAEPSLTLISTGPDQCRSFHK